jgi:acyl carrier protein
MEKLHKIIAGVLDIDIGEIKPGLEREVTEEWDSFNHLLIIHELEKELGIKFALAEVEQIKTLEDLEKIVAGKFENNE